MIGRAWRRWWSQPAGGREVMQVALPLMVSTGSWTVMTFIDRLFLLWYSPSAVAASVPAGATSFTALCFFLGIATYVNAFVAQYYGAGRHERVGPAVWQGIWIGIATIPIALALNPLAPTIFEFAGHDPAVRDLEVAYFRTMNFGAGAQVLAAAMSAFFTGRGQVRTVMIIDVAAAVLNIVLDYAWIFGHWGFPAWGIIGAGWATVTALWFKPLVYAALLAAPECRRQYATLSGWRLDPELMIRLWRYGSPSGVHFLLEVGAFSVFMFIVGRLGELELTATNLAITINMLAFMPVYGIGIATTSLVGQRLGENQAGLAARSTWSALAIGGGYNAVLAVAYVLAPHTILSLLTVGVAMEDAEYARLESLVAMLLRFVAAYCLFDTMNMIFSSALKGAGDTRFVLFTTLALSGVPAFGSWLGVEVLGRGLYYSWSVLTLWVCLLGVVYLARFLQGRWRSMRVIESSVEDARPDLDEQLAPVIG